MGGGPALHDGRTSRDSRAIPNLANLALVCGRDKQTRIRLTGSVGAGARPLPACRERVGVSDCVVGQAFCHGLLSRMMALRMVRSFRAVAMRATILDFPAATRRSRKALRVGL